MGTTRRVFRRLALLGFALSLVVHLLASAGLSPSWGKLPVFLVCGLFVLWIPIPFALDSVRRKHPGRSVIWVILVSATPVERLISLLVVGYFVLYVMLYGKGLDGLPGGDPLELRLLSAFGLTMYWMLALLLREPA